MTVRGGVGPVVVMGVTASGKSTVGSRLADHLGVPFIDADDLHPPANVEKMRSGVPLDDADRGPWLDRVGAALAGGADAGVVVACSALRRRYRDHLRRIAPTTRFVHLDLSEAELAARLQARTGHFMPPALLSSQLATLEGLEPDERGIVVDGDGPVEGIVEVVAARLDGDATG